MSDETKPVSVSILDKEYFVTCDEKERESLFVAVEFLNMKMQLLRESGKVVGTERIAVITALNIAHEYLEYKNQKEHYTANIDTGIRRMQNKIARALNRGRQ